MTKTKSKKTQKSPAHPERKAKAAAAGVNPGAIALAESLASAAGAPKPKRKPLPVVVLELPRCVHCGSPFLKIKQRRWISLDRVDRRAECISCKGRMRFRFEAKKEDAFQAHIPSPPAPAPRLIGVRSDDSFTGARVGTQVGRLEPAFAATKVAPVPSSRRIDGKFGKGSGESPRHGARKARRAAFLTR